MAKIGAHVSISGGPQTAPERAQELNATALGMFTKNQRQWNAKPPLDEEIESFKRNLTAAEIAEKHVVIHASYLINVANPDPEKREKSIAALIDECRRAEQLGLRNVNFHPGSGLGSISESETITAIAEACTRVLEETQHAVLVLESTAGQGAHVGYRFEHLSAIIDEAKAPKRLKTCVDTCHMFAAGYELDTVEGYQRTIEQFDATVGLRHLVGVHLNDSMTECGSRRDRHECIGAGKIGITGLAAWVQDSRLSDVPFILETTRPELWRDEIRLLTQLANGEIAPEEAVIPAFANESEGKGEKS
ncbi:MAG: deoxyribonuclease IV [Spirochaetales bacterium]